MVNLILAIVAMSYDELQKKMFDEEEAAAAEEAAFQDRTARLAESGRNKRLSGVITNGDYPAYKHIYSADIKRCEDEYDCDQTPSAFSESNLTSNTADLGGSDDLKDKVSIKSHDEQFLKGGKVNGKVCKVLIGFLI